MFNRKFSSNIRRKKRMIRSIIILLVVFLGIGYSAFTTNLSIDGTLNVSKYDQTLYGVLEKAAKVGTYAKEYTGEHHDSFTVDPTKKIYHWYAPNTTAGNTLATEILDKNNVIFANHCWQMIRTTDTGGVKMVYNGEPENGQCLNTRGNHVGYGGAVTTSLSTTYYYGTSYSYDKANNLFSLDGNITTGTIQTGQYTCKQTTNTGTCATLYFVDSLSSGTSYNALTLNGDSHYSQFGKLKFNKAQNSLSYVGYMYNKIYPMDYKEQKYSVCNSSTTVNANEYYSDTIDYGNLSANKYTLINPQLVSDLGDYSALIGKYMLSNGSSTSYDQARYIVGVNGTRIYFRPLKNGDLTRSMMIGSTYVDNGNGTYTVSNPTEVTYLEWYGGAYSNYKNKYICEGSNPTCSNLLHSTNNTNNTYYYYWGIEHKYKYSSDVNYSNGVYTLSGDIIEFWDIANTTENQNISTHHYTCLTNSNTCNTVYYIEGASTDRLRYAILNDVEDVSSAIHDMLYDDEVNNINSIIKIGIDAWYEKYLAYYSSYLEETIFCNDRDYPGSIGPWNPNGGGITIYLGFNNNHTFNNLSCDNITDKFSISNNKAKLFNSIGLISSPEFYLINNLNIIKTNQTYWLISPKLFSSGSAGISVVSSNGNMESVFDNATKENGIRPTISLKPGTEYTSGDGSMASPYIVE